MASQVHLPDRLTPPPLEGAPPSRSRILVADDERVNRTILTRMLGPAYEVDEVSDGTEAVARVARGGIDLVLMDLRMPGLDGLEATRLIKRQQSSNFVPVIMMTADSEQGILAQGIDAGADDFLVKPVARVVLEAKLKANLRLREMFLEVQRQRDELGYFREHARKDYAVAERVFENILSRGAMNLKALTYSTAPMESFNGDLVMVTPFSDSILRVFVGDFTGHGLSAAVGALPVADIFYATAARHLSMETTLREMNIKLRRALPSGMFLSACMVDIDPRAQRLVFWNGGLPTGYLIDAGGAIRSRLASNHVPLGILPNEEFDDNCDIVELGVGDRVFLYSDGVIETANVAGELLGSERIETVISHPGSPSHRVQEALLHFREGLPQSDDVTFCEIREEGLGRELAALARPAARELPRHTLSLEVNLETADLKKPDPLIGARTFLEAELNEHGAALAFTVLSELFLNSLDHGILRLQSTLKDDPEGFYRFFELREEALARLTEGGVRLRLSVVTYTSRRVLTLQIEDSGFGFTPTRVMQEREESEALTSRHGRGLTLVHAFCSRLAWSNGGRTVEADMLLDPAEGTTEQSTEQTKEEKTEGAASQGP